MVFVTGFLIWLAIALAVATVVRMTYRAPEAPAWLTYALVIFGTFIGGMLGVSGYVYHDPFPTRVGALIGATLGAIVFGYTYHVAARKAM